jgi:hypothetical protein
MFGSFTKNSMIAARKKAGSISEKKGEITI